MAKSCYARQGYGRTGPTPSSIDARPRNADPPDRRISRPPRRRPCRRRRLRNADPPDRRISRRLKVPCPGIVTGHRLNPTSGRGASRSGALGARVASGSASHVVVRALARRQRPGRRPRGPPPAYGPPSRPEQPVKHPLHIDGRGPDPPAGPFFGELVHELPYAVRTAAPARCRAARRSSSRRSPPVAPGKRRSRCGLRASAVKPCSSGW